MDLLDAGMNKVASGCPTKAIVTTSLYTFLEPVGAGEYVVYGKLLLPPGSGSWR